jgi:hypothetical protein
MGKMILAKCKESLTSVLPIAGVALIILLIVQAPAMLFLGFFLGTLMLIIGMTFFNLGADLSMMEVGIQIGSYVTKKKKVVLLFLLSFLLGFIITIAEPDLEVLSGQLEQICNPTVLKVFVALGVGIFLLIAMARIIFQIPLSVVLFVSYLITFLIVCIRFKTVDYSAISFDAGGVTTGPITVPFIMALGIGVASARSSSKSSDDSFGLVALCSIGPIMMVSLLSFFFKQGDVPFEVHQIAETGKAFGIEFWHSFFTKSKDVLFALIPILFFIIIFEFFVLKEKKKNKIKIGIGLLYTYIGLVIFLTGADIGFLPAGTYLGKVLSEKMAWTLIPIGALFGFFVVMAEPAVHVLNKQVEELSGGAISQKVMLFSLAIGVSLAIALAMMRIYFDFSVLYIVAIGYGISFVLSLFTPKIFTAVAFDSGGVASGPLTTAFLLPMAIGFCLTKNAGNTQAIFTDGFGLVALVALAPVVVVETVGFIFSLKQKKASQKEFVGYYEDILEFPIERKEGSYE